jgi:UDP-N-acetylglucosamine 2-epimerase
MMAVMGALERIAVQTLILWPNIDAGSDVISKIIREARMDRDVNFFRTLTNLTPEDYLRVLNKTACAVGNSSSFVRDAGYFGTPVALVGNRQNHRERDVHVVPASPTVDEVERVIRSQLAHGRYAPSTLYGDGHVAARIANALVTLTPYVQKHLAYVTSA